MRTYHGFRRGDGRPRVHVEEVGTAPGLLAWTSPGRYPVREWDWGCGATMGCIALARTVLADVTGGASEEILDLHYAAAKELFGKLAFGEWRLSEADITNWMRQWDETRDAERGVS